MGSNANGATIFLALNQNREIMRTVVDSDCLVLSQFPSIVRRFRFVKFFTLY